MKYTLTIQADSLQELIRDLTGSQNLPAFKENDEDESNIALNWEPESQKKPQTKPESRPRTKPEKKQERICANPECGKKFMPAMKNSQFCSKKCYQKIYTHKWCLAQKQKKRLSGKDLDNKVNEILSKIKKEIPIREVQRPEHYHDL